MQTATVRTQTKTRSPWLALGIVLVIFAVEAGLVLATSGAAAKVLTTTFTQPLDGATSAKILIDPGDGNLTIAALSRGEAVLARGTLQYQENKGQPAPSLTASGGQAQFTLKGEGGQPWLQLPWAACNSATDWQIQLNPSLPSDITAHSAGGNFKLDLTGMQVTRLAADNGGGNMDVVLPDQAADLNAQVKTGGGDVKVSIGRGITGSHVLNASSGAGNVTVRLPAGTAARIRATSGAGNVSVDAQFSPAGDKTYQSSNYDSAPHKVEITVSSGAGNVTVSTY